MTRIIDISYANKVTDWDKVKQNVEGVIIRIGYRGYVNGTLKEDARFRSHVEGVTKVGIPVGFYFMSQAMNRQEGIEEADYCYERIKDMQISLPVFFDSEYSSNKKNGRADYISKEERTWACLGFCERLKELGVKAGVYASKSWFTTHLVTSLLTDYYIWCAQYNYKCTARYRVDLWQYTSKGTIPGVSGYVDQNKCYICFADSAKMEITTERNPFKEPVADVKRGQTGDEVGWVQWHLWRFGSLVDKDGNADVNQIDTRFGGKTQQAVMEIQRRLGMKITGIVTELDREVWKRI